MVLLEIANPVMMVFFTKMEHVKDVLIRVKNVIHLIIA